MERNIFSTAEAQRRRGMQGFVLLIFSAPLRLCGKKNTLHLPSLLLLAITFNSLICVSQGITNQTTMYVADGVEVHLDGFLNNSGFIQNQGNILLSGQWLNSNVYQGLGTITLEGATLQQFDNNGSAVYNLVVSGGGSKKITGTITVSKSLSLKEGIVMVSSNDKFILEDGLILMGGSVDSYIDGALDHVGSGYKFFPIGKNGGYYPAELLEITGANVTTAMEVFDNSSKLTLPSNYKLFSNVYWQRTPRAGTFLNSPLSLGYSIPDGYTDSHKLDILQADNNTSTFSPLGEISVDYQNGIDKISTSNETTASVYVIGESTTTNIPGEGIFYLSTSLSPSANDPQNRTVKVFGGELQDDNFHFIVYNRWGLKVFESLSLKEMSEKGWDGSQYKGHESLPSGSYPFILKATDISGQPVEKKGAINIIR
ncbi:MAG: gliding motility-associated C-terminal domain-containing protein [Chryseolinea sp.]